MIETRKGYLTTFICSDNKEFDYYHEQEDYFSQPPKEVLDYQKALDNKKDLTFDHGFKEGDLVYVLNDRKIHKAIITKVEKKVHTVWQDIEKDEFHHSDPTWLDDITYTLSNGKEDNWYGPNINIFIKRSLKEFLDESIDN